VAQDFGIRRRAIEPVQHCNRQRSNDNGIDTLLLGRGDGSQISLPFTELTWKGAGTWLLPDAVRDARGLVIPVEEERLEVARERLEHVPINQVVKGAVL
jgi:hypothetical protein